MSITPPGHWPAAVTLHRPRAGALFSGDLILKDAPGRTDLPDGDGAPLMAGIGRMATLDAAGLLFAAAAMGYRGLNAVRDNFERMERTGFGYVQALFNP